MIGSGELGVWVFGQAVPDVAAKILCIMGNTESWAMAVIRASISWYAGLDAYLKSSLVI